MLLFTGFINHNFNNSRKLKNILPKIYKQNKSPDPCILRVGIAKLISNFTCIFVVHPQTAQEVKQSLFAKLHTLKLDLNSNSDKHIA